MARAHDLLSLSEDPQHVVLADYLGAIGASLALTGDAAGPVGVRVAAPGDILVAADRAVAVGLIVNELATNALKHALPPPTGGTVEVSARRTAPDRLAITARDRGVGMAAALKENLGFRIIRSSPSRCGSASGWRWSSRTSWRWRTERRKPLGPGARLRPFPALPRTPALGPARSGECSPPSLQRSRSSRP